MTTLTVNQVLGIPHLGSLDAAAAKSVASELLVRTYQTRELVAVEAV